MNSPDMYSTEIESFTLELKNYVYSYLTEKGMHPQKMRAEICDNYTNSLAHSIYISFLGNTLEDLYIEYPTTWWDAFKDRWFSSCMRKRWPIHYTTHEYKVTEVYPTFKFKMPDNNPIIQVTNIKGHRYER